MKVKTTELQGSALDWAVAKCEGITFAVWNGRVVDAFSNPLTYHDDWALAGPIIERERISVEDCQDGAGFYWESTRIKPPAVSEEQAPTALIAAMRCYVASELGDEVEVPDELA